MAVATETTVHVTSTETAIFPRVTTEKPVLEVRFITSERQANPRMNVGRRGTTGAAAGVARLPP
ncbi:hypothetical protein, partial [Streptomyces sp. NPDC057052]|uniref:hypothetical protein n=1 Tax=Streptomyces sp. NPDC057052 TaxID=3346010 RepID=UPI00362F785C